MKLCIDCRYYKKKTFFNKIAFLDFCDESFCVKSITSSVDMVNGRKIKSTPLLCDVMRSMNLGSRDNLFVSESGFCGNVAKWFVPKDK